MEFCGCGPPSVWAIWKYVRMGVCLLSDNPCMGAP
jgi:hypothetical protein